MGEEKTIEGLREKCCCYREERKFAAKRKSDRRCGLRREVQIAARGCGDACAGRSSAKLREMGILSHRVLEYVKI
jgi:hypothetical protein